MSQIMYFCGTQDRLLQIKKNKKHSAFYFG